MIDVCILYMPDSSLDLLAKCLISLKDEPVRVHFIEGERDAIGKVIVKALNADISEYISLVDADDEIVPGIYNKIIPLLKDNPTFVYTDEIITDTRTGESILGWSANPEAIRIAPPECFTALWDAQNENHCHHRGVFRRDTMLKHAERLSAENWGVQGSMIQLAQKEGSIKHLKEVGYIYKIHGGNGYLRYT